MPLSVDTMPPGAHKATTTGSLPLVNIGWIHPFLEILEERGIECVEILQRVDLPTLAIDDGSILVPTAKIYEFVALAAEETGIADLGLRAGSRLNIESMLPDAASSWRRPGAFRTLESFIQVALEASTEVDMWLEEREGPPKSIEFLYLGTFGDEHRAFETIEQFMLAVMVRWARHGGGEGWNPGTIRLRATAAPLTSIRQLAGGAEVRCGEPVTSIIFPSQRFLGPMETFPPRGSAIWQQHHRLLHRARASDDLAGPLRLVLRGYLPDGSPGIEQAARLAGTSVRTLQRRLGQQGTTYSSLLENLRHDLAIHLLEDTKRRASAISQELGYRDPASFTRAFRRWTGLTPSEYREVGVRGQSG